MWRVGLAANGRGLVKFGDKRSEGRSVRGLTLSMFDIENVTLQDRPHLDRQRRDAAAQRSGHRNRSDRETLFDGAHRRMIIGQEIRVDGIRTRLLGVAHPFFGKVLGFSRGQFRLHSLSGRDKKCSARAIR
jgi:hypothetical protein